MNTPLLEFRDVSREFTRFDGFFSRMAHRMGLGKPVERLAALQQINLQVRQGETLGIVGESGCGKTTLGRIAAQILGPSSGEVLVRGTPLSGLPEADARAIRTRLQMVFQNPYASLNPRRRIGDTIVEAALTHGLVSRANAIAARDAAMRQVGLSPEFANRFPHQLSGGQRQRVGIARALMVDPQLVVFDEAVAALDVSIQAQILGVLQDLRKTEGFTSMFISHDLNVVRHISDRVAILYLGRVVEIAPTQVIFAGAHHPYARALLDEAPKLSTQKRRFSTIKGELPSPLNPPSGCHFHPRCPFAQPLCAQVAPQLREIGSGHHSACHIGDGLALPATA